MADLTRTHRWESFVPDLGDNRAQPKPFFLLIASGLTKENLRAFHASLDALGARMVEVADDAARIDAWAEVFAPYVQMGDEPLVIDGKPIATLRDYLALLLVEVQGQYNTIELSLALADYNSFQGTRRLFFERLSGGPLSTPALSSEKAAPPRAAPSSGTQTSASSGAEKTRASSAGTPRPQKEASRNRGGAGR